MARAVFPFFIFVAHISGLNEITFSLFKSV